MLILLKSSLFSQQFYFHCKIIFNWMEKLIDPIVFYLHPNKFKVFLFKNFKVLIFKIEWDFFIN
jgi:hypothetical protein